MMNSTQLYALARQLVAGDIGELEFLAHMQLERSLQKDLSTVMTLPNHVHRRMCLDMFLPTEEAQEPRQPRTPKVASSAGTGHAAYWSRLDLALFNGIPASTEVMRLKLEDYVEIDLLDQDDAPIKYGFKVWNYEIAKLFAKRLTGYSEYFLEGTGPTWYFKVSTEEVAKLGGEPPKLITRLNSLETRFRTRFIRQLHGTHIQELDLDDINLPLIRRLSIGGFDYFSFTFAAADIRDARRLEKSIQNHVGGGGIVGMMFELGEAYAVLKAPVQVLEQLDLVPNGAVIAS